MYRIQTTLVSAKRFSDVFSDFWGLGSLRPKTSETNTVTVKIIVDTLHEMTWKKERWACILRSQANTTHNGNIGAPPIQDLGNCLFAAGQSQQW